MAEPLAGAITLPDGTTVRGRGLSRPLPPGPLPTYGLYLGRPPRAPAGQPGRLGSGGLLMWWSGPSGGEPAWRPDWPAEWVDWPDFRTPRDGPAAAAAIQQAYRLAREGERVEVACHGGTGRTGTVLACLAVLAGHPAAGAVEWVRRNYRPRAVETPGQRRWVEWFADHHPPG